MPTRTQRAAEIAAAYLVPATLAISFGVAAIIVPLMFSVSNGIGHIEARLDAIDGRLSKIEGRLEAGDGKVSSVDTRLLGDPYLILGQAGIAAADAYTAAKIGGRVVVFAKTQDGVDALLKAGFTEEKITPFLKGWVREGMPLQNDVPPKN